MGNQGFIDEQGKVRIPLIYDAFTFNSFTSIYSSGLIRKAADLMFGYVDSNDKTVIPYEYEEAGIFLEDKAIVGQKDQWSTILYGVIDKNDNVQIPLEYNYLGYQYNDLIQLRQKHLYIKGNECYELKLENYIACVTSGKKAGVL